MQSEINFNTEEIQEFKNLLFIQPTPEGVKELRDFYKRTKAIILTLDQAGEQLKRWITILKLLEIQQRKEQNSK